MPEYFAWRKVGHRAIWAIYEKISLLIEFNIRVWIKYHRGELSEISWHNFDA